jgi:NDP-sugar pyrophosphorylase family protein
MFPTKEFFSLHDFEHASLWRKDSLISDALHHLEGYLTNYSYKIDIQIPDGVHLKNKELISIGEGTTIDPGVLIEGPCIIGKNCRIRHGAFLRGFVILGNSCVVGHCSEVKHSIIMNGASAAHLCYVGDSIIGPSVNLGAGVKCANLRLDRREVSLQFEDKKIQTGLKKLGAILGEGVQIGCNCVLNPGTVIGKKSVVFPLLNIGGTIPPMNQVKGQRNWTLEPRAEGILQSLMKAETECVL